MPSPSYPGDILLPTLWKAAKDGYFSPGKAELPGMSSPLRDIILQVKENADIVQIVGQYVPLKKVGARYLGLCPFHHDRSPSLNVTPQMGIYKCFACGAGGDVLKFVQEYEKLDFLDALRAVASRAGINIPEHLSFSKDEGDRGKAGLVLAANQIACRLYQEELEAHSETLAYLGSRGVSAETRKHFQLGLAPQSPDKLLKKAAVRNVPTESFIEAGILGEAAGGRLYDRFQGRLIFPIWNMSGHVIGFGGRVLPQKDPAVPAHPAKYVNSPESPFYHKSKVLYGLNFSRNAIDKSGEAVIVEGYMDLLALWQAGIQNAVAVSGTALTKEHVHILARFARKAFLFFDGDEAGRKAVRRSLEPLLAMGLEVKVPVLPAAEDPDSFTRKFGGEKVLELFHGSEDLVGFLLRSSGKSPDAMSPEEKEGLLKEGLTLLQAASSDIVKDQYLQELRKKLGLKSIPIMIPKAGSTFGLKADSLGKGGQEARKAGLEKADMIAVFSGDVTGGRPKEEAFMEWQLLQLLLSSHESCLSALDSLKLDRLQVDAVRNLIDHLLAFVEEEGGLDLRKFLARLSQDDQNIVAGIRLLEGMDLDQQRKHFSGIMYAVELRYLQKRLVSAKTVAEHVEFQKLIRELKSKTKGGIP